MKRNSTKKRTPPEPKEIDEINWAKARYINGGGFAAIFKVGARTVAKVGEVDQEEADLQTFYARLEKAVPVLDYQANFVLPKRIRGEACPTHGPRKEIVPGGESCTCQSGLDVLLMPMADLDISFKEATDLMAEMFELQQEHPEQRPWDERNSNCAKYNGKPIALDFGSAQ